MKKMSQSFLAVGCLSLFFLMNACIEEEPPFDAPFVYITDSFGGSSSTMDSEANYTASYSVRLSSKQRSENLSVHYDIVVGDGLQEEIDFSLIETAASPLVFEPNVYEQTIRIAWRRHQLDDNKDNRLQIVLRSTSDPNVAIGKIGPDGLGRKYTITKE